MTPRYLLFSHTGVFFGELNPDKLLSVTRTEEINGEHSLSITTTESLAKTERILTQDGKGIWHEYVVTGTDTNRDNGEVAATYYCVWSIQHDLEVTKVNSMPGVKNPITASSALDHALAGTERWAKGNVTVTTSGGVAMQYISGWEALSKVVEVWGGEVVPRISVDVITGQVTSRKVDLLIAQGNQTATRRFDYGSDVTSIKRTVADDPLVCRIIPRGKVLETDDEGVETRVTIESVNGGIEYLQDNEAASVLMVPNGKGGYEYPTLVVINDDIETPQALKDWGNSVLTQYTRPKVTYETDVVQLAAAGMDVTGVALGDAVQCVDKGFNLGANNAGLRITGRVVKIEQDELDPTNTTLTIGWKDKSLADQFRSLRNSMATLNNYVTELAGEITAPEWLDTILDTINAEINATGGYTYLTEGQGIRTYDKQVSNPVVGAEADKDRKSVV